ncbi:MAG: glycosyltransferase family 39 protein [Pseudomonadota bacterium]|nr:glycosyltransferase family 39 protein [Pseudomonadota bacterium]
MVKVQKEQSNDESQNSTFLLLIVISIFTAIRITLLLTSQLSLHGDEAQYWSWSQDLNWGYFTKPPLIAWVIHVTTLLFGNAEWAVRLSSPILHAGTSFACALIAKEIFGKKVYLWAGITFLTLPAVSFSSFLISTDVPLLFFWSIALYAMLQILKTRHLSWAILLGIALGLGLLSKYAMCYFLICSLLACGLIQKHRWFLKSYHVLISILIALVIISPNIFWNFYSGWATVTHLGDNINLKGNLFNLGNAASFLAEQAGVFGPILFGVLIASVIKLLRNKSTDAEKWLLCYILPIVMIVTLQAFLSRANANWAAVAYVSATALVSGWLVSRAKNWILYTSTALHSLVLVFLAIYFLNLPGIEPPLKSDPLRKLRGWDKTSQQVAEVMGKYPGHTLLTDDRKVMAALIYGLRQEVYKPLIWDYDGIPNHHYELTARYYGEPKDNVLLVAKWETPAPILERFVSFKRLKAIKVPIGKNTFRTLHLFKLSNYQPG